MMVLTTGLLLSGTDMIFVTLLIAQSLSCPKNCVKCNVATTCEECVDGYYNGHLLDNQRNPEIKNCSLRCNIEYCEACTSYKTCTKCKSGFCIDSNNRTCQKRCNDINCESCESCDVCTRCRMWYYGKTCKEQCGYGCKGGRCNMYDGYCTCRQNVTGDKCDRCVLGKYDYNCDKNCTKGCRENFCDMKTGACISGCKEGFDLPYCDSCIDGFYLNGDTCEKCPDTCLKCTSSNHCSLCKKGFWGRMCQHTCPQTCISCVSGAICQTCIQGHYGLACADKCPEGCKGNTCEKDDGYCSQCKAGYNGQHCNICDAGFWGQHCNTSCSRGCLTNKCQKDTGVCPDGCRHPFTGERCDSCVNGFHGKKCLKCQLQYKRCESCSPNCSLNECKTTNGFCLHGCIMGLWGRECEKTCDLYCAGCNQTNGDCLKCTDGRYGIKCLENCSTNCGRRNGVPVCNQNDGQCLNGCSKNSSYGTYCENECSKNCLNGECHWKTGHCILGCINGFHGKICDMSCSKNCVNNSCNRLGGDCSVGCRPGFKGTACTRVTSDINLSVIIGTGSALIVILIGITTTVICKCHKRNRTKPSLELRGRNRNINVDHVYVDNQDDMNSRPSAAAGSSSESGNVDNKNIETRVEYANISKTEMLLTQVDSSEEVEIESYEDETLRGVEAIQTTMFTIHDDGTYYNTAAVLKRRIPIDKLKEFVSKKTMDDFIKEFKELPAGLIKPYGASQTTGNFKKNRYRGLYPYDKRRVVIGQSKDDYINASYIDGHNKKNAYIACMGPTTKHMGVDFAVFWEMIWQESVSIIVMLTNLKELGVPKCDKYWPDRGSQGLYGDVQVTCLSEDIMTDYTIRTFTVQKTQKRKLYQMHFTSWPDKGIPESVHSLTDFQKRVNNLNIVTSGPVVVHCSAGIGRTGTYIALDILTKEGRSEKYVDIFACARNMREDRVNMIQTADQYMFLHQSLVHVLTG